MANRSSKSSGSRKSGSPSSPSQVSGGTERDNEMQSCPTPGEPSRESSISNDDEEEE